MNDIITHEVIIQRTSWASIVGRFFRSRLDWLQVGDPLVRSLKGSSETRY